MIDLELARRVKDRLAHAEKYIEYAIARGSIGEEVNASSLLSVAKDSVCAALEMVERALCPLKDEGEE